MKRLLVPILICLLTGAGSVVALEIEQGGVTQPEPSTQALQSSIDRLQKQVAELKQESMRQSALITQQSEVIQSLEQKLSLVPQPAGVPRSVPAFSPLRFTPQQPLPLQLPMEQWRDRTGIEHPSAAIPNMPKGTQQRWINGMPFYIVPCATSDQTNFTGTATAARKTASFVRDVTVGAAVVRDASLSTPTSTVDNGL